MSHYKNRKASILEPASYRLAEAFSLKLFCPHPRQQRQVSSILVSTKFLSIGQTNCLLAKLFFPHSLLITRFTIPYRTSDLAVEAKVDSLNDGGPAVVAQSESSPVTSTSRGAENTTKNWRVLDLCFQERVFKAR